MSVSFDVPLPVKNVSLTPTVNYTIIPESMQGKYGLGDSNKFWIAIGLGAAF